VSPTGLPYIPSCPTLRVSEWHFTGADVSSMLGPFTDWNEGAFAGGSLAVVL
jgi:hypothetical protein